MIDTRQLRIGNWVLFHGEMQMIDWITLQGTIGLMGNGLPNNEEQIEAIPLTPEVLVKCGFEKDIADERNGRITYSILKMDGALSLEPDGWVCIITDVDGYYTQQIGRSIQHLHQLQNLYTPSRGKN
jgi:hypothetical protein